MKRVNDFLSEFESIITGFRFESFYNKSICSSKAFLRIEIRGRVDADILEKFLYKKRDLESEGILFEVIIISN